MNNIFVIGGGAAGMMAAIYASKGNETKVTILEQNSKLGKKLFITGKGRCNLTNASSNQNYLDNIISNPNFLRSALHTMNADSLMSFFNTNGLKTKIERGNRVFPNSDKSSDVIKTLSNCLNDAKVNIEYNQKVVKFKVVDRNITEIITETDIFYPDNIIFATGGMSYSSTGSDGYGYQLLKSLRHTIIEPKAALVPILIENGYNIIGEKVLLSKLPSLQGLSLKNVEAKIISKSNNKCIFSEFGEMMFTHNGFSGPIILSLSSRINRTHLNMLRVVIDLKPALDFYALDNRLLREFEEKKNKLFKNSLDELLPNKLIPFIISLSKINPETQVNGITREQRHNLCRLLKNLSFEIKDLDDLDCGIITAGGVSTKEIDPKTMNSKIINNLYLAGEVIDVDALTGGYNLQIAFSTGCVAGMGATKGET